MTNGGFYGAVGFTVLVATVAVLAYTLPSGGNTPSTLVGETPTPFDVQDTGRYATVDEIKTAVCEGVVPITQTALAGSCGGRLDVCGSLHRLYFITKNPHYECPQRANVGGRDDDWSPP